MLEIKRIRIDRNNWYDYYLKDGNNELKIMFMGNGDLYFGSKFFDKKKESEFYITKENMVIYSLFENLFDDFKNLEIFKVDEVRLEFIDTDEEKEELYRQHEEWNNELKESSIYKKLFNNDTITWISDDALSFDYETTDALRISKENDRYKLKFTFYDDEFSVIRSIRIRNSGSRYDPFNMLMMDFFIKLQEYDPEYHQNHIEEYCYKKMLKNNRK